MDGGVAIEIETKQEARVFRVAVENVMPIWDAIRPLILAELTAIPTHDEEDIRKAILSCTCHLWVQWSDHVEAMVITDFVAYPRGLALRVWLGSAYRADGMDWRAFRAALDGWAAACGCKWIDACGRVGWLKRFSDARMAGVFMRIPVATASRTKINHQICPEPVEVRA